MGCQSSKGADSALLSPKRSSTPALQSDTPPSTPPKTLLDSAEGKRQAGHASAPIVSELVDARRSSFVSSGSSSESGSNGSSSLNRGHSFLDVSSIRPANIVHSHASSHGLKQRCAGNEWQCKFRFVGERVLDFEVYKTNAEGGTLGEIGHVKERRRYVHEGFVTISNDWDFSTARFFIDGVPFTGLPSETQRIEEPNLTTSPVALLHTYGISTPYLVDQKAPSNMMMVATQVFVKANESRKTAGGFFARCCDCTTVDNNDAIQTSSAPK